MTLQLFLEVMIMGLVLSADSFSAALAMGNRSHTRLDAIKFASASGSAEALVCLVGAFAGVQIMKNFSNIDHWIAFSLLMIVALHMLYESINELRLPDNKIEKGQFHSFTKILIVSFATSLDALGVGIGLGISQKPLLPFVLSIGAWAFLMTLIGLYLARKLSKKMGPFMGILGSIILIFVAIQMLSI